MTFPEVGFAAGEFENWEAGDSCRGATSAAVLHELDQGLRREDDGLRCCMVNERWKVPARSARRRKDPSRFERLPIRMPPALPGDGYRCEAASAPMTQGQKSSKTEVTHRGEPSETTPPAAQMRDRDSARPTEGPRELFRGAAMRRMAVGRRRATAGA